MSELKMESEGSDVKISQNPLLKSGTKAEQFEWVCDWLGRMRLTKTLDSLLEEGEDILALAAAEADLAALGLNTQQELEVQFRAIENSDDHVHAEHKSIESIHSANVLSVRFLDKQDEPLVITGGGEKVIKVTNYETGDPLYSFSDVFIGPVVTMDVHPSNPKRVLMGSMDASHAVIDIDAKSHSVVSKFKDHRKHVVRARWAPNGRLFASASYDGEVHVYSTSSDASDATYSKIKTLSFKNAVEAIAFTADSQWLIAAPREDNYLHYFNTETWKEKLVNMNASGDEHVSFTAMDLTISPDGKTLLTSTDKNRVIMFAVGTSIQARNFWGVENGQWSTPRSCFNLSQSCVYTTSEDNNVYIFDVGTEKKQGTKLSGHKGVVRDIHRHATKELVATCSYDRSVKIWI